MKQSCIQLNDLPDEILMIIFKKLNNVAILYSLMDVNKRLDNIVHDIIFTSHLALITCLSNNSISPLLDSILDRFCSYILPKIHYKIKWLDLESSSMKRIFCSTNYPNLNGLGLYNIEKETAISIFKDETLPDIIKNQISSLVIEIIDTNQRSSIKDLDTLIFSQIFTTFINIQYLCFRSFNTSHHRLSFDILSPAIFSSTLLELHVRVNYYEDCFYLLDGRFNQLHTFYVTISSPISSSVSIINNKKKIPNLKCFSLTIEYMVLNYDEIIVPLLHRMPNLEKLILYFFVYRCQCFIDGIELKTNIINYMPQINEFAFNIRSLMKINDPIYLLSNDTIQHTFRQFKDNQIISYIDYFSDMRSGQCHIYTYPYKWKQYESITNNFPGGLFKYVYEVSLYDERPFEYEFFLLIAQSFPFMKKLTLSNEKSQNNKQCQKSRFNNKDLSIIKYSHLIELDLSGAHDDYIEQFLDHTKTYLPNNVHLRIYYESLQRVTYNFTRDITRINHEKLGYIKFFRGFEYI